MVGAPAYGPRLRPGPAILARRRILHHSQNFVFVHVPKTGGTSIREALGMSTSYHYTAREVRQMYPETRGKFSFAFVRNPWDRLVSYMCSLPVPVPIDQLELRPQVDFLLDADGEPMVDFIGRYETLAADFVTLCDKIDIPTPALPHVNRSQHRHYREYFNDAARQGVANLYKEDIERFGYEF
jgi:Sulfotransferase family